MGVCGNVGDARNGHRWLVGLRLLSPQLETVTRSHLCGLTCHQSSENDLVAVAEVSVRAQVFLLLFHLQGRICAAGKEFVEFDEQAQVRIVRLWSLPVRAAYMMAIKILDCKSANYSSCRASCEERVRRTRSVQAIEIGAIPSYLRVGHLPIPILTADGGRRC